MKSSTRDWLAVAQARLVYLTAGGHDHNNQQLAEAMRDLAGAIQQCERELRLEAVMGYPND